MTTYTYDVSVWQIVQSRVVQAAPGTLGIVLQDGVDSLTYRVAGFSTLLNPITFRGDDILSVFVDGQVLDPNLVEVSHELGTMSWDGSRETIVYAMSVGDIDYATSYFLELAGDPLPDLSTGARVNSFLSRLDGASSAPAGSGFGPGEAMDMGAIPGVTITEDDRVHLTSFLGPGQVNTGAGDDLIIATETTGQAVNGGSGTDTFRSDGFGLGTYGVEWADGTFSLAMDHGDDYFEPAFELTDIEWFEFSRVGGGFDRYSSAELRLATLDTTPVTLDGTPEDDLLTGGAGADILRGEAGHDTLTGGEGADTLIGGLGNDVIDGGGTDIDVRDVIYGGAGNDHADGGYGNDELRGDAGNDTLIGGNGADTVIGGDGDDVLTAQAWGDMLFGGAGDDFLNGGYGYDRANGGSGADRFYHLGVAGHGSDWVQDFSATDGDRLVFGGSGARADQFQVNLVETGSAGATGVEEAFVIYRPTGQILWALVDGAALDSITLVLDGVEHDLFG